MRKEKKWYEKIFQEVPPLDMLKTFEQTYGFQTPRLARELWKIGENILRKEKLWDKSKSAMIYQLPKEFYSISHEKVSTTLDRMTFEHAEFKYVMLRSIIVWRKRDGILCFFDEEQNFDESLKEFLHGRIVAVLAMENSKDNNFVVFD